MANPRHEHHALADQLQHVGEVGDVWVIGGGGYGVQLAQEADQGGDQVIMSEHHTLGDPGAAAGVQDDGGRLRAGGHGLGLHILHIVVPGLLAAADDVPVGAEFHTGPESICFCSSDWIIKVNDPFNFILLARQDSNKLWQKFRGCYYGLDPGLHEAVSDSLLAEVSVECHNTKRLFKARLVNRIEFNPLEEGLHYWR